jgi:hypothetical protein
VPYGEESLRIPKTSWRFQVNPEGKSGWSQGTGGRTEREYGKGLTVGRQRLQEREEVRKVHGYESNGRGRKGRPERGYVVYGEYTGPDRRDAGEGEKRARSLEVGRARVTRKYETWRKGKVERKRTNLKDRRRRAHLEGEKAERALVRGATQASKRKKVGERCEAVCLSGRRPTGKRRGKVRVRELEQGLNHLEVRRNRENRRAHHAKSSPHGRKTRASRKGKNVRGQGGYYGYEVVVNGPLGGSRRTRTHTIQGGTLPRGTKKARRPTSFEHAKTKIGTLGVRVTYAYSLG